MKISDVNWNFSGKPDDKMVEIMQRAHDAMRISEVDKIVQNIDRQEQLEAISERASKYTLTREDYEVLAHFDEADFLVFLQRHGGIRSANDFVQLFLSEQPRFVEHDKDHKEIRRKIISIIQKAAQESKLNHFRLRGYLNVIASASDADAKESDIN